MDHWVLRLCDAQFLLQATICDGLAFDPFAFEEDGGDLIEPGRRQRQIERGGDILCLHSRAELWFTGHGSCRTTARHMSHRSCRLAGQTEHRAFRGASYCPQTQGKIERWHQTLKNRILLENYYLPGDLERQVAAFVEHYNHDRYHRWRALD